MPTFTITKQLRAGTVTTPIVDPVPVLAELSITVEMDVADLTNPSTDVRATIEWAPAGSSVFRLLAEAQLVGNPANRPTIMPFVSLSPSQLGFLVGQRLRGKLTTATALNIGASVVVT